MLGKMKKIGSIILVFISVGIVRYKFFKNKYSKSVRTVMPAAQRKDIKEGYDYICIGSSAAGVAAARAIKRQDKSKSVLLITMETSNPYNKCNLSSFLRKNKDTSSVIYYTQEQALKDGIDFKLGVKVTGIKKDNKVIVLDSGQPVSYKKLLLATGSRPSFSAVKDFKDGVLSYYTLDDAMRISDFVNDKKNAKVLVVGAGLNGVELAGALEKRGAQVTLINRSDFLLKSYTDKAASDHLKKRIQENAKVVIRVNTTIDSIQKGNNVTLNYNGKKEIEQFDMIVVTSGMILNNELAQQAGLEMEQGSVKVNQHMQTSDSSIYAAGDIAWVKNAFTQEFTRSSKWSEAESQGRVAGIHMVKGGSDIFYEGYKERRMSSFFGLRFVSCGCIKDCPGEYTQKVTNEDGEYIKLVTDKDNRVKGFIFIGTGRSLKLISLMKAFSFQSAYKKHIFF